MPKAKSARISRTAIPSCARQGRQAPHETRIELRGSALSGGGPPHPPNLPPGARLVFLGLFLRGCGGWGGGGGPAGWGGGGGWGGWGGSRDGAAPDGPSIDAPTNCNDTLPPEP